MPYLFQSNQIGCSTRLNNTPASNNACIELMPEQVASIIGVRGMFRQAGGAISVAIIALILHNIGNMTAGFNIVFLIMSMLTLTSLPFIFAMPSGPKKSTLPKEINYKNTKLVE